MFSWSISLALALALLALLGGWLLLVYRKATRRTRTEQEQARERHREALEQLASSDPGLRLRPGGDPASGWAAVEAEGAGLTLLLGASADLRKTTFIRYATRLTVRPRQGAFALPAGIQRLELKLPEPEVVPESLADSGLPRPLLLELTRLAAGLLLEPDCLVLTARPGGDATLRYSYGYHLLLLPAALARLLELGRGLGQRMLEREARRDKDDL